MKPDLKRQLDFIIEIDKLKSVLRQTTLTDGSRRENSAEHSWHLALMAVVLQDVAAVPVDILHVVKMLLIHDIVEIDCGDTYCYDADANVGKYERERLAAERLFGLLPDRLATEFRGLWEEFEARQTPEAQFAAALDRVQPLVHNFLTSGATWQAHGISADQVYERNCHVEAGSPDLWKFVENLIEESVNRGYLAPAVTLR